MVRIVDSKTGTWESRAAASMTPALRKAWKHRIAGQNFEPIGLPIALYSGLSENERKVVAGAEKPRRWLIDDTAGGKWLMTGLGADLLNQDFGSNWTPKREVCVMASLAYIRQAKGDVVIFVSSKRIDPVKAAAKEGKREVEVEDLLNPVFYDELMNLDVLSPLRSNPTITGVTIKEVAGGRVIGVMPLRTSQQFH